VTAVLGVDIGTTGTKAALYDLDGKQLGRGYRGYSMNHIGADRVEQDPEVWWLAVQDAVRDAVGQASVNGRPNVAAVSISSTNASVLVDDAGTCVRPAIMQIDQRAQQDAARLAAEGVDQLALAVAGNRLASGLFMLPTLRWLAHNESENLTRSRILYPSGYAVLKMTGRHTVDPSRAATSLLMDLATCTWSEELVAVATVDAAKLPEILDSTTVVGGLLPAPARALGLTPGVPVVAGAMDTVTATLGAGVTRPHSQVAVLGTMGRLCRVVRTPVRDARLITCPFAGQDQWLTFAVLGPAGASLAWAVEQWYGHGAYAQLEAEVAAVEPGSDGVRFAPYLGGQFSPHWNGQLSGSLTGLRLRHKRAHLARSVLEGVAAAFGASGRVIDAVAGSSLEESRLVGGGSRSAVWAGMLADALDTELQLVDVQDSETLGAAMIAAVGIGCFESLEAAGHGMTPAAKGPVKPSQRADWLPPLLAELGAPLDGRDQ
jgi:xylulokinase